MKKITLLLIMALLCVCTFSACVTTPDPLVSEKEAAISEISVLVSQKIASDYSTTNFILINSYFTEARQGINSATEAETIIAIKQEYIDKISAVLTIAEETEKTALENKKADAKLQLQTMFNSLHEDEYPSENWKQIITLFEEKNTFIEQATVMNSESGNSIAVEFYESAYIIDMLTDKHATINVVLDGVTDKYDIRFKLDYNPVDGNRYYIDQHYARYVGIPDISERLRLMPQKDGYLFLGWFNSSTSGELCNFILLFYPYYPISNYYLYGQWKQIPTTPIPDIDDIVGVWTTEIDWGFILDDVFYSLIINATLTIDEFGLVTLNRTYTLKDVDEELAEYLYNEGYYEKSDTLIFLCEFDRDDDTMDSEYLWKFYKLYYYDFSAKYYNVYPNLEQHGMWMEGANFMFDGINFTKSI